MRFIARHRPSPSMVVALLALSIALGGTGYAAIKLPKNSVGAKQLKRNAVTGAKVKDASLFANDFAAGQIPRGPKGDTGAQGPQGTPGATGAPGAPGGQGPPGISQVITRHHAALQAMPTAPNTGANLLAMQLPAGKWLLSGLANGFAESSGATFRCYLLLDGGLVSDVHTVALGGGTGGSTRGAVFSPQGTVDTAAASTVVLRCDHFEVSPDTTFGPDFGPVRITAIRADSLDAAAG